MRYTQLFTRTLRDVPADAETASHRLALRAGLIRPLAAGIFSYLPLGLRVKQKIEAILREEMAAADSLELLMPVVQPAELWRESGRWESVGEEMLRALDRGGRELCLAMTHEEAVTALGREVVQSYRQLPLSVFQIQTKFRDEPRSRAGLIRVREFTMKDAYSFHVDQDDLDAYYPRMYRAYENVYRRVGLGEAVIAVESDPGMMGGNEAHEFMYLSPIGEDTLILCDRCGYRANRQVATAEKERPCGAEPHPMEEVATPDCATIESLAELLEIETSETAKAVFTVGEVGGCERLVFAVVRGDHELNETKLANTVGATNLRPATDEEIRAVGAEPGYGSPVGVSGEALVVVDELVSASGNLVSGANREGYHYRNVNVGRDYEADVVADLVAVSQGMKCAECGAVLRSERGVEVGNTFKLGSRYSEAMGATYLAPDGKRQPLVMASYGIGVGRLLACVVEQHHDADGIVWPTSVAPFDVHVVSLGEDEVATRVAAGLEANGMEALLDDRDERAGVKFNDADLIGLPVRVTVGTRGLSRGTVEVKRRSAKAREDVGLGEVVGHVERELDALRAVDGAQAAGTG